MLCSHSADLSEIGQPGLFMALIDEINRAYPYQVRLSLDDGLDRVLDWLDARLGRWDMYVDLHDQSIRYCFRNLDDASAFARLFGQREAG